MQLGDLELHLLVTDKWKADGGLMFGVVPRILWEKEKPPDANNMIDCACVCLIARINGRVIVCETGIGTKLSEKRARQVALREPEDLLPARHFVQRTEWDFALHPDVRSATGYYIDDFTPLADGHHSVEFLDGDAEVFPGVHVRHVGGHTPGSQILVLQSGELGCAVTGDLVCQTPHLRVPWNMSADIEPLRVFEEKARLFEEAEKHRWLLVLSHETDHPAGYLEEGGRWRPEPRLTT
ncbi:MAG: hypothetical protein AUI15_27240 [Actinobacteria bacterium 13_2_20CM_2_66_6]|nr:MAG: hypothetical protein AUI15_27240 [Actinobacteria bacterium 13_2_20CM_2_66_6]